MTTTQIIVLLALPYVVGLLGVFAMMRRTRMRLIAARNAQRELRRDAVAASQKLSGVLESITEGFLTLDSEWRVTYINTRGEQMLGAPRGALIGRRMLDAFPEGEGSQIHLEFERARRDLTPVEFESLYQPGNRWFEIRGYPSADGTTTVYFRDITKRKRAQEALSLQARMLDTVGQAVIGLDPSDSIFYWNRAAADLFGWESKDVRDKKAEDFVGEMKPGETVLSKRDGSTFPALIVDTKLRDEQSVDLGTVRVVTDLTERFTDQQAQRFLANTGSDLASTLDLESLMAVVASLAVPTLGDCCIVDVIEEGGASRRVEVAWSDTMAREGERRSSRRIYDTSPRAASLLVNDETTTVASVTDEALSAVVDGDELQRLQKCHVKAMVIAPLKAGGRMLGTITVARASGSFSEIDEALVTEFARRIALAADNAILYERARLANQAKSDFLAVMSHELRTPLTTVMGYTDLLLGGVSGALTDQARTYADRIKAAALHLLGLIEQILIYTRTEVGREQVQTERVFVDYVLRDAAALIEPVAAEKGLRFRCKTPEQPVYLDTDMVKLRQVLVNLLGNAVKFTDEGDVVLEARATDARVQFLVHDTGIGIAPEHIERVFDSFWQVDQSSTRRAGGTGLGLSVARRLARLLGGDVSVASSPGVGTTFTLTLPRVLRAPVS
jgi:PAS domain S-box-containing protein